VSSNQDIKNFVKASQDYYVEEFNKIGNSSKLVFSFNIFACLFGPLWFGIRSIWGYAFTFLILETFFIVQIVRGFFGDVTTAALEKLQVLNLRLSLEKNNLKLRLKKLLKKLKCLNVLFNH